MRIHELIEELEKYDDNIEVVIESNKEYVAPVLKKEVVKYRHSYNGVEYIDDAIILGPKK